MTTQFEIMLKNKARAWAGQVTRLAKSFAPAHVRSAISSHVEEKGDGTFIIRTIADKSIAPDARAQEFGSGLHARRGVKRKYPIVPKTRKVLAFNWEVANANPERFIFAPDGRVLLPSVQHPGIEAANNGKGYIRPAEIEIRKRIKEDLAKGKEAIRADLRLGFTGKR